MGYLVLFLSRNTYKMWPRDCVMRLTHRRFPNRALVVVAEHYDHPLLKKGMEHRLDKSGAEIWSADRLEMLAPGDEYDVVIEEPLKAWQLGFLCYLAAEGVKFRIHRILFRRREIIEVG